MPNEVMCENGTGLSFTSHSDLGTSSGISNLVDNNTSASHSRFRRVGHSRAHTHGETESDCLHEDHDEVGEHERSHSACFSQLRQLVCLVQKSLPFIIILSIKVISQHVLGLAVAVGLFSTFLYTNTNIQTQVFLQDRRSKLQCFWLLSFLMASSLHFYYIFQMDSLYYSLIFISPQIEPITIWDVLWTVGVTSFIVKFLCMGLKCLVLLLPACVMVYRRRGQWYMFIEELGQFYQVITPVPLWFHYLLGDQDVDSYLGIPLDIILALLYIILKLLELYSHWGSLQDTVQKFLSYEVNGVPATQSQCSGAGDLCLICRSKFKQPRVLLCQHVFCEECTVLWFNQEKTCPICHTMITDRVHKWKGGATSAYLQIY